MAKRLNSALGVDIGSQSIKIAEVRLQGKQPVVTALGEAVTPEGAVDHVGIHDHAAVGTVLKELCSMSGASIADAVISVAGQGSVLVRTLEVPNMNEGELKQHMDWEITRNIPFAESDVVSDFKAFPPDGGNAQQMDVVMAISPQSAVNAIVDMAKKAGKKAAALDVEPLGLARLLTVGYEVDLGGRTICVVDIGHKTSAINMYKDGKLLMPRQVPIGGEMFTRAIAEGLGVSFQEAEQLKHDRAEIPASAAMSGGGAPAGGETQQFTAYNPFADTPEDAPAMEAAADEGETMPAPVEETMPAPTDTTDPETLRIYNAMANIVDEFTAEVRRSVDYFRSKGGEVDRVLLCGGGSRLRGLAPFLRTAVGIETELFDPFKGLSINLRKMDPAEADQMKQDFAVAIGNGLHILF